MANKPDNPIDVSAIQSALLGLKDWVQKLPWFWKLIIFGISIFYVLNPVDLPGPIDDAAVMMFAMWLLFNKQKNGNH
ncbi:hypothetical protein A2415_03420 [candidate division WWE3 bacterium RIFOXYC1_FULL_39_7]|uniref:Uncharacterized protein n=2 Tax=Katanobacteria TaxID=422282 RepID=A0A1F4X9K3_UNCKA|nr:MAG: hypothetical protein A2415_03420 [candidate division WWE3 bacterium RIFOXYC1_FULL_39_7]OGC78356.1 MAG: hypothetical protein A2619_05005 [candidate division WWE3 bacterium RIFOXYD1_FULL_39_9]